MDQADRSKAPVGARGQLSSATRCLESILADQFEEPEDVRLFGEFEELAKMYAIELPLVSRTRIERVFEVYDGKKFSLASGNDEEDSDTVGVEERLFGLEANRPRGQAIENANESQATPKRSGRKFRRRWQPAKGGARLTWCRLLFNHNNLNRGSCCISKSETTSQFASHGYKSNCGSASGSAIITPVNSIENLEALLPPPSPRETSAETPKTNHANNATNAAHSADDSNEWAESEQELRNEVLQMFGPILGELSTCSSALAFDSSSSSNQTNRQPSILADVISDASGQVSVCLLDKRNRIVWLRNDAESGRRWANWRSRLEQLRSQLGRASAAASGANTNRKALEDKVDEFFRDHRRRGAEFELDREFAQTTMPKSMSKQKLSKAQFGQLIEQTKTSLNNLIDAQLLLRNKVNQEQEQQPQSSAMNLQPQSAQFGAQFCLLTSHSDSYETLLRNNFNLLKVWQNLEETKKMACFVCEPIKANLGDLFEFNRQRCFGPNSLTPANGQLLSSPLVSLDAIEVKQGLLQILEALNFLHVHCKLIHRDVNPRNILVAANDNWKLSGLQFAVKFESATISESASVMRFELSTPISLRFSSGHSSSKNNLRRQRTLHQTKCDEFERNTNRLSCSLLQPELDYLAPEIFRHAQCSHKSDMFSLGLVIGQTYDFRGGHKPPLSCRSNPNDYERALEKLNVKRKRKLCHIVPFEMKLVLVEMLECEPNLRPSANLANQILRRPLELCKENDHSLRHLRSALGYLDAASAWWQLNPNTIQLGVLGLNQFSGSGGHTSPGPNSSPNNIIVGAVGLTSKQQPLGQTRNNAGIGPTNADKIPRGRTRYFRKVISASDRQPHRKQARNLFVFEDADLSRRQVHLRNRMASLTQDFEMLKLAFQREMAKQLTTILLILMISLLHMLGLIWGALDSLAAINGPQHKDLDCRADISELSGGHSLKPDFLTLRNQFELSLDALKQVYKLAKNGSHFMTPDSRTLMLSIASHRRLLDQLALMRQELPPLSRLTNSNPTSRLSQNHRILSDLEDQFVSLVCRHSMPRLSPHLADPTLKLDEFIIAYELINDLVAFVGLKSRQSFIQRGKQLLNDITPPTGCLSSSSSSDDDDDDQATPKHLESGCAISMASNMHPARDSAHRMSTSSRRYTRDELEDTLAIRRQPQHRLSAQMNASPIGNKLPTRISITAPSPMGSMKDVTRGSLGSQGADSAAFVVGANKHQQTAQQSASSRQHQQIHQLTRDQMAERANELRMQTTRDPADATQQEDASMSSEAPNEQAEMQAESQDKSRSQLIDELLSRINDDSFNDIVDLNNKFAALNAQQTNNQTSIDRVRPKSANDCVNRSESAIRAAQQQRPTATATATATATSSISASASATHHQRPRQSVIAGTSSQLGYGSNPSQQQPSTFDNVIRRMSTNFVQNFNRMSATTLGVNEQQDNDNSRRASSNYANSLYVDNQIPTRRHSDNTINIPKIQVGLSSPQSHGSRNSLNQRGSVSVTKIANKWKMSAKTNQNERTDKLSPTLNSALGYMRRHSSGNTNNNEQNQSNGHSSNLLFNVSPFKTKSSSNLGLDFLMSNRSMKRRCSAASMLGHQTQRKAEDLIDAGMKSVQNMFS